MIVSEWILSEDFFVIQIEMIDCFDEFFKIKLFIESIFQKFFIGEFMMCFQFLFEILEELLYVVFCEFVVILDEFFDLFVVVYSGDNSYEVFYIINRLCFMEFLCDM